MECRLARMSHLAEPGDFFFINKNISFSFNMEQLVVVVVGGSMVVLVARGLAEYKKTVYNKNRQKNVEDDYVFCPPSRVAAGFSTDS